MSKKFLTGYLLIVHLFLFFVLLKSDFINRVRYRVGLARHAGPEITEHFREMIKYHERIDANIPAGAVFFIGDSIIQGLYTSADVTLSVNFGIGSDTTVGVLKRLPKYQSLGRASVCILAVGVNDLRRRGNEEILKNYSLILQNVPSRVPVVLSALLPVDERVCNESVRENRRIKELNAGLKTLCESQGPKCTFVDIGPKLVDLSGNLKEEYHEGDGVHLTGVGNSILLQDFKEVVQKVQQAASKYDSSFGFGVIKEKLRSTH